jgi:hypothetical protein
MTSASLWVGSQPLAGSPAAACSTPTAQAPRVPDHSFAAVVAQVLAGPSAEVDPFATRVLTDALPDLDPRTSPDAGWTSAGAVAGVATRLNPPGEEDASGPVTRGAASAGESLAVLLKAACALRATESGSEAPGGAAESPSAKPGARAGEAAAQGTDSRAQSVQLSQLATAAPVPQLVNPTLSAGNPTATLQQTGAYAPALSLAAPSPTIVKGGESSRPGAAAPLPSTPSGDISPASASTPEVSVALSPGASSELMIPSVEARAAERDTASEPGSTSPAPPVEVRPGPARAPFPSTGSSEPASVERRSATPPQSHVESSTTAPCSTSPSATFVVDGQSLLAAHEASTPFASLTEPEPSGASTRCMVAAIADDASHASGPAAADLSSDPAPNPLNEPKRAAPGRAQSERAGPPRSASWAPLGLAGPAARPTELRPPATNTGRTQQPATEVVPSEPAPSSILAETEVGGRVRDSSSDALLPDRGSDLSDIDNIGSRAESDASAGTGDGLPSMLSTAELRARSLDPMIAVRHPSFRPGEDGIHPASPATPNTSSGSASFPVLPPARTADLTDRPVGMATDARSASLPQAPRPGTMDAEPSPPEPVVADPANGSSRWAGPSALLVSEHGLGGAPGVSPSLWADGPPIAPSSVEAGAPAPRLAEEPGGTSGAERPSGMKRPSDLDQIAARAARNLPGGGTSTLVSDPTDGFELYAFDPVSVGSRRDARGAIRPEVQPGVPPAAVSQLEPAPSPTAAGTEMVSDRLVRIERMVSREALVLRQLGADSLAVVLKPDAHTELFLQFTQRDGQLEAYVRCERGDFGNLSTQWQQLQDSLALQNVRLLPLKEGLLPQFHHTPAGSPALSGDGGAPSQQHRPSSEFFDDRVLAGPPSGPGRRDGGRRPSPALHGWETWA